MAGHQDPRLLYSIPFIRASHIQHGDESSLTPSGPQTLSLLMVPTSSPYADPSTTNGTPEEDFYLHLHLPPELDLPLPATTQIYHQPPHSYLIPRWDLGPDSGAFTRIEFPPIGKGEGKCTQEDVDTFETILAQCTAFLERAQPPINGKGGQKYDPSNFMPGEAYVKGTGQHGGQIVLIDEDNGSVVGELTDGAHIIEDPKLNHGTKTPVEVEISADGKIYVQPISDEFLRLASHPAYRDSSLVQNAAAASRLLVTGSNYISGLMANSANTFTQKVKPNEKPLTFTATTHKNVRKINNFTQGAAGVSSKTIGSIGKYAQNIGAGFTGRGESKKGEKLQKEGYKPGLLNKTMIAFSTITDGMAESGKSLLTHGAAAASTMVGHKYGSEAGNVTAQLAGGVKNVGLVYIDVTGVSRRAVIKSVAKGMVVGRVKDGGAVVVGGGDGGEAFHQGSIPQVSGGPSAGLSDPLKNASGRSTPTPSLVGFGNAVPPSYASGPGENIAGLGLQGKDTKGKY